MTIYYKDGFYLSQVHSEIPLSAVEISENLYRTLIEGQSKGFAIIADKNGIPFLQSTQPSLAHTWDGDKWVIDETKQAELLTQQRQQIHAQITTKRDQCVNGGVYVPLIDKWIDTDEAGRATLVEIKADFDLNGKENVYTLICADHTAKTINFDEFKAVWDAAKTLKERMFENAYMHKVLLEAEENPTEYDWSIGWSQTYEGYKNEQTEK